MSDTSDNESAATELLFSYGTLRSHAVQQATFGRLLDSEDDQLEGYTLTMLQIVDPAVIATSGESQHPIVVATGQPDDRVDGSALKVSMAELALADEYEVSDYRRERVKLVSGRMAWAYVDARLPPFDPVEC